MFTVTFVLYEKDGLDRTEALRYWRETHGPIVAKVPGGRATCSNTRWRPRMDSRRSSAWRA